jgi:hypothetical protein
LFPTADGVLDILPSYMVLLKFSGACIGLRMTWIFNGSAGVISFSHLNHQIVAGYDPRLAGGDALS